MSRAMKIFDDEKLDVLFLLDRDVRRFEKNGGGSSDVVGIICPFPVEIGLSILKIRVRQILGCLTIDYAPADFGALVYFAFL